MEDQNSPSLARLMQIYAAVTSQPALEQQRQGTRNYDIRAGENGVPPGNSPYLITPGPDYNKWDETLFKHGAIHLPKELDNPQQWMNQHNEMLQNNNIERQDMPDGSVILRLREKAPLTSDAEGQRFAQLTR